MGPDNTMIVWPAEQVRGRWPETAVMASSAQDYITNPFGREMLRQALQKASATIQT